MSAIDVSTREYEFSHGKQPRGYGMWAFFFEGIDVPAEPFWHTGKYAEAKRFAVAYARTKGYSIVKVGS